MSLSELLQRHNVEKTTPDPKTAQSLMANAKKDITAAKDNLKTGHADWALAIAYNSMLSAGRALMAKKGFRPSSDAHHVAVVQFCSAIMPAESSILVASFNKYRVRRHDVVYGESAPVGEDEARRAIERGEEFVKKIEELLK